ncbi:MAG: TIGR01777 family oxidoreductase [Brevibacterium yomogidense]
MTRFHSQETIAAPLDQVVRWHSLPGAVTRLSPHWAQTVVAEGNPNAPGTRTSMKIAVPGSRGSVRVPWKSEHFSLDDPGVAPLAAHSQNADPQQNSPTALTGSAFGFGDLMVDSPLAPLRSWEHRHVFRSAGDPASSTEAIATSVEDDVTVELPRAALLTDTELGSRIGSRLSRLPGARIPENQLLKTLRSTFAARTDRLHREFDFLRQIDAPTIGGARPLRILISGASGLVGTQLCALLMTAGHTVRRLVRHEPAAGSAARARTAGDPATASAAAAPGTTSADDTRPLSDTGERPDQESRWDPQAGYLLREDLAWADVVVNLSGRSIGGRLTDRAKDEILTSRIDTTRLLATTIAALPEQDRPEAFICASAVGLYGTDRRTPADEAAPAGDGFLAEVCRTWEAEAAAVESAGVRRVSVRTGLVMSGLGGLLALQVPLYLAGGGGPLGSGEQWFPWISHDDLVRVYARAIVDATLTGPVNAVAPGIVRQKEFAKAMGSHVHRPAFLRAPRFGPALLLGEDGADELALAGQHAVPTALERAGFDFAHPGLGDCLTEELGPR